MPPDPPTPIQIDEGFLAEWIEFGWSELLSYLAKWAAFRRYEEAEQEEPA